MFSEGREDVNDEERAGRPSTSTTDEKIIEVEKMILANRRITVREVAEDLNISIGSCHSIFINDLDMRRVAAKFVPKFLNCDQKQHRMNIANEMLDSVRDDPNLLQRVITGVEALRGCRHEPKTSFRVVQTLQGRREETADNERSGRPSTSTTPEKVDKVLELVHEDRRITVREVAEEAGISFGSTQSIMKDILGNARKETASLNLEATTDDPELLKRVITGDKTCFYGFDSETTQQASEWRFKNEPRTKKARKAPSKVKVMLTVFFDYQGIVHHEFQQQGSTITADFYLGVLRRLREAIRQKRLELWRSKSWILHHDHAPAHKALKISKFLQDHSTSVFPNPPTVPIWPPATSSFLES
ncbi:hypothetical protein LAZ67_18000865 [Cordylochernes scorpioides]|uniref:Transposase n=1 Tax=Cordylochernes scorpioides TaxID=51811 RepID=A0ABY6LHZ7_9ARAC|nr:hypothetical protein LAZ67_18000865 [Cordylochernes scorpioides]